jgi:hypothetical protein
MWIKLGMMCIKDSVSSRLHVTHRSHTVQNMAINKVKRTFPEKTVILELKPLLK